MPDQLRRHLLSYGSLTAPEAAAIAAAFTPRTVRKGDVLQRGGEICTDLLFVERGVLRTYYAGADGRELSMWFSVPGYLSTELTSFFDGRPSAYVVEAITDGEVLWLPKPQLLALYQQFPALHDTMRQLWEYVIQNVIRRFTSLQYDTAEQRYLDLVQRPDLLRQIPQKYLASYIGVTPTSLSRIRRRLAKPDFLPQGNQAPPEAPGALRP